MHNLPMEERPRERLLTYGAEALSTIELLAVLLGSGSHKLPILQLARQLLERFGNLSNLAQATMAELLDIPGIGLAKGVQIKAAFQLGLRAAKTISPLSTVLLSPEAVYQFLMHEIAFENRECLVALFLDMKGKTIAWETIAIGTLAEVLVHPREVFYPAIRHKAATVIVAHNHPSGDPTPSAQDIEVTKGLIQAGHFLGIPLQDHIIIGQGSFVSLRALTVLWL